MKGFSIKNEVWSIVPARSGSKGIKKKNLPKIIDVSKKKITKRIAVAEGIVKFSKPTFKKIESLKTKKGEIENIAIIAGIIGAKKTSELIPLCHNINIDNIEIDIKSIKKNINIKNNFIYNKQK